MKDIYISDLIIKDITNSIIIFLIKKQLLSEEFLKKPIDYGKFQILYKIDNIIKNKIKGKELSNEL